MRNRLLALMLCASLLLTGCASALPGANRTDNPALPSARPGPPAPVGDSQTPRDTNVILHIPDPTASRLTAIMRAITVQSGQSLENACIEALLFEINETGFSSSTQPLQLALVSNAVETTGDLATVNLSRAVRSLSLSGQAMFALQVAITKTLTELPGIRYVNVLVGGQDIGFSFGALPTGVMARYPGVDIATYWNQIETQRVLNNLELQKTASLYFVTADGQWLLGEARDITFPTRTPAVYARVLLEELSRGALQITDAKRLVPESAYFDRDPVYSEAEQLIEIYCRAEIDGELMRRGATRAMLFSSICYTLCSFIPVLNGVKIYIDDELISTMMLMNGEELTTTNGIMQREHFAALAADTCTIYFPLADGTGLRAVQRAIPQRYRTQPRALLRELTDPPKDASLAPVFPEEITDADFLSLQVLDDTALINLSPAFAAACEEMSGNDERNMIYAIVNTLTEVSGIRRVRFYVDGQVQDALAGTLFMGGEFLRHSGLIR